MQTHYVLAILTRIKRLSTFAIGKIAGTGGAVRAKGVPVEPHARPGCRGRSAHRPLSRLLGVVLLALISPVSNAADDPYLQLLDAEVTKVEGVSTDTGGDGAAPLAEAGESASAPSRGQFEAELRQQHVGTYSFYRRLPERSREEIFIDYSNGASTAALRDKIVDRFLHP